VTYNDANFVTNVTPIGQWVFVTTSTSGGYLVIFFANGTNGPRIQLTMELLGKVYKP